MTQRFLEFDRFGGHSLKCDKGRFEELSRFPFLFGVQNSGHPEIGLLPWNRIHSEVKLAGIEAEE